MRNPLKFAQFVGNVVGKIEPPITYRRILIRRCSRR